MAAQYPYSDHPSPPVEPKADAGGLSRPLSYGEKECLAMQAKNRATAGMTFADVEKRQAAPAVDMGKKASSHFVDSIGSAWRRPRQGG
jgi:hypothetical protein